MRRVSEVFTLVLTLIVLPLAVACAADVAPQDKGAFTEANKFFERGNKFVEGGSLQRAKQEYEKALKIYPKHLDVLYNLGVICERLGLKGEAIDQYKRYLEIKADDADVWTQVGMVYDET